MRYSQLFLRTNKESREYDSVNATLLIKGGFVDQVMAGAYTFLPLGWRVLDNIENIIREEMDTVGAEMLMPALAPRALWEQSDRLGIDILFEARGANNASQKKNKTSFILNPTHEDIITPLARLVKPSYRDLPFAVYQIQTKFRNEERPKSGLLRGREFRMKDLYSFHASKEDLDAFYDQVKEVYTRIFDRLGLGEDTVITRASGGDFTKEYSHEFQTFCETGEDTVYLDPDDDVAYNVEVVDESERGRMEERKACEVGNIFPLNTKFSEAFGYTYTDKSGAAQPVYMASYGIGSSRAMGVLVEKFHDDKGIVWPEAVAPFKVYLASLSGEVREQSEVVYKRLREEGVSVLYDDRDQASAGEKLADADLLGVPWRVVVSERTGDQVEIKRRGEDKVEIVSVNGLLDSVSS